MADHRGRTYPAAVSTDSTQPEHPAEPHTAGLAQRLNWLRAGVLGANDGIVSTAAVVVGVAGGTDTQAPVLLAGAAALVGGAISMALGEYVSVSSQRDSERALIEKERGELRDDADGEYDELVGLYRDQGLSDSTARLVATELTAKDALRAHLSIELNLDEDDVVSPWHAALASAVAFTIGALLPLLTILLAPEPIRLPLTFVAVGAALAVTGWTAAWIGGARPARAVARTLVGAPSRSGRPTRSAPCWARRSADPAARWPGPGHGAVRPRWSCCRRATPPAR